MRIVVIASTAWLLISAPLLWAASPASGDDSLETSPTLHALQRSLADLDHWLGANENGSRWRAFLRSKDLETAMAQRTRADRKLVTAVLQRYQSGVPGLECAPFAKVHHRLVLWAHELDQHAGRVPAPEQLAEVVRGAQDEFRPVTEADVEQARQQVLQAMAAVDNYLTPGTANTAAWKEYLQWEELRAQLQPGTTADLQVLGSVYRRLTENHTGLELSIFRNLAEALQHYGDLAALAGQEGLERWFQGQLERLAGALEQYPHEPDLENRSAISESLGRFTSLGLVPQIVDAVKFHYSRPNLWADVSVELLGAGFRDDVSRPTDVYDYILGTKIVGEGYTTGDVQLRLIPSYRRAVLETLMTGNTASKTRGYNGPVVIHSKGNTGLAARKWIFLEPEGVRAPGATASAVTETVTTGISAGHLVRHIASRRIAKQRDQANAIASQHAEARLARNVDEEASELVTNANREYQNRFRYPLLRRDEYPALLAFTTTWDGLSAVALQANRSQLGAPTSPPPVAGDFDLTVRLHETLPNNAAEAMLGGRTFESDEVRERIVELRGSLPPELEDGDDEEPWSITFARRNPVTLDFADGQVTLTIRGQRYTSGDRQFGAMNVGAVYRIESTDEGLRLMREGELQIFPPGFDPETGRLGAGDVALRRILQRRFSRLFPETVDLEGFDLPGRWARAGRLQPVLMQSGSGWLQVGWNIAPPAPPTVPAPPENVTAAVAQ